MVMDLILFWAATVILAHQDLVSGEIAVPHKDIFGPGIDDSVCSSRDTMSELDKIISGDSLPYGFLGPASGCDTWGCRIDYWMSRCRWDAQMEPACPLEAREKLVARLSQQAQQGSNWVRDAFLIKPCDLWPLIRGRTIWVVGDSLSQDFATGLACYMVEYMGPDGKPITEDVDIMHNLSHSPSGKEMRTWCLYFQEGTRICSLRANKVPRLVGVVMPALTKIASREQDIAILNVGAWYNYAGDGMAELEQDMLKFEVSFSQLRVQLPKRLIWRESTAQHFNTTSGMFDAEAGLGEQRCAPAGYRLGVQLGIDADKHLVHSSHEPSSPQELDIMLKGGHRNTAMQPVIDRLSIETLRIWNVSLILHEFHNNYHRRDSGGHCVYVECDCSHACSPSWYPLMLPDLVKALQKDWDQAPLQPKHETGYNRTVRQDFT